MPDSTRGPSRSDGALPRHVAIILDGNGRWATTRGLPRLEGHRRGADSVRTVVRACRRLGVEALTLYAFSAQNWARPVEEVAGLMALLVDYLISERREILDNGIRFQGIGDLDRLPALVRAPLDELTEASSHGAGMTLSLALSYGGREELAHAARALARQVAAGRLDPESIDERHLEAALWTRGLPSDVDLLIRTGGDQRVSNFLLWQLAYAELWFTETMWPEFGEAELFEALEDFGSRERRLGLVDGFVGALPTASSPAAPSPGPRAPAC